MTPWGANGDIPVPGDYDRKRRVQALDGTLFVRDGAMAAFGTSGDVPLPLPPTVKVVLLS